MHTYTHACTLERGRELCLCYKKMSAHMSYSKLKQSFISSVNITLSYLCKKKSSIYKCQSARFILELTCEMPATIYQLKGISSQEMNQNVDKLIARLGDPDRDSTGVYLYCSRSDETHCSEIQRCFIFKLQLGQLRYRQKGAGCGLHAVLLSDVV